jgi:hypothetical protein
VPVVILLGKAYSQIKKQKQKSKTKFNNMKKNSLSKNGLSMSQAQSISNLCNQEAQMIASKLNTCNNATKTTRFQQQDLTMQRGIPLPANVISELQRKAKLSATQAFLMENIKAKEEGLKDLKKKVFVYDAPHPEYPDTKDFIPKALVDEDWGWSQLSVSEMNEFLQEEAYASHLGQFIHKDSKLDSLRKELTELKELEWMNKGVDYTPVVVTPHHTPEGLLELHNQIAALHRAHEQKVNYFKAKVKNLVSEENATIAQANAVAQGSINSENNLILTKYRNDAFLWEESKKKAQQEFESERANLIREMSSLRINVDSRFQDIVDSFLSQIPE